MKRIISLFISIVMILSGFPFAVLAEGVIQNADVVTPRVAEESTLNLVTPSEAQAESKDLLSDEETTPLPPIAENMASYSGYCGDNLSWSLDTSTGVLSITGTGAMANYNYNSTNGSTAPWASKKSYIISVTIPDSVTTIGSYAFYGCDRLTSVTIPDSVTSIGIYAFSGCTSLKYNTYDNAKYLGNTTNPYLALINANSNSIVSCTIHPDTKCIGERAFYNCSGLTSITIPNSVTSIGAYAFDYCRSLTSVTIPDSVTSIGYSAFEGCSGLTSVTIPNSVTSIEYEAFSGCSSLTSITIPDSVTSIGSSAFYNCSGLTSVIIGNGVTSIGYWAFEGCFGLTRVEISDLATWCGISFGNSDANPLYKAHHLYLNGTEISDLVIPDSVTSIGERAFYNCSGLTSVTIGNGVTSIGTYAFRYCSGLTDIRVNTNNPTYHSVNNCLIETKGKSLILGCKASIIPSDGSVTSIGSSAFYNCSGLTSVTIPDSVKSIGSSAFEGCDRLTSVTIPDSVTYIGSDAFRSCSGLTSMTIGNGVKSIGSDAFRSCSGLTSITIGNGVKSIGDSAFSGCDRLTSINIPNSVTSIGSFAFYNCSGLTSVTIPNSVTTIGDSAFRSCSGLTSVSIPFVGGSRSDQYPFGYIFGTSSYTGGTETKQKYYYTTSGTTSTTYYIPSNLKNVTVTGGNILYGAFYNCSGLTSITIGESITSIGTDAFYNCLGLKTVRYDGSKTQWNKVTVGSNNTQLTNAAKEYLHLKVNWSEATYTWKNDYSTCSATIACIHCGEKKESETVTSSVVRNLEPACTTAGISTYTAAFTNEAFETQIITVENDPAPLGHDLVHHEGKAAACTEIGWDAYDTCSRCDYSTYLELDPLGHDYGPVVTPPTCLTGGYTTYTCSYCGDSYVADETEALGHDYVPAVTPPTCLTGGYTTYTCSRCGDSYVADETEATGHNWGEPSYTFSANGKTCTAERVCLNDPTHTVTETVNTISTVSKTATCEEMGETTYVAFSFANPAFTGGQTCALQNVAATGHRWGSPSYTWSRDDNGEVYCTATRICRNDGSHVNSETVMAFGVQTKNPTCDMPGETTYLVAFDNAAFKEQSRVEADIPARHTVTVTYTWSEDNASCTATWVCSVCGAEETETVATVSMISTPATEETEGVRTYYAAFTNPAFEPQVKDVSFAYSATVWGDANGDGEVTNKDIIRLKNYFANLDGETGQSTVTIGPGADANGDGLVNNKDIVRLKNYFANFDPEEGTSAYILGPA